MKKLFFILPIIIAGCSDLSDQTLADWKRASESRRIKAVAAEHTRNCITRMSQMPNTGNVKISSAEKICTTGIMLKEQNAKK